MSLPALAQHEVAVDAAEGVSTALLRACKAGNRLALEELFERYAPKVFRWAVLLGLGATDAQDAAQEVLVTAARRIASCDEAAWSSWLFQITRRVVANARRFAWVRRIFRAECDDASPAFEAIASVETETELAVRRCFARLSRLQAEVLLLREVEGYTRPEVAQMLGVPEGTVASRLRLAREAFRREWELDEGGGP